MAGDQTSIWKKEIKLRKRGTKPAPEPAGTELRESSSIWKKELKFGRSTPKSRPAEPATFPPDDLADELVAAIPSDPPVPKWREPELEQLTLDDPPSPPAFDRHAESVGSAPSVADPGPSWQSEQIGVEAENAHVAAADSDKPASGYGWRTESPVEHADSTDAPRWVVPADHLETGASEGPDVAHGEPIADRSSDENEAGYGWVRHEAEAVADPESAPQGWNGTWRLASSEPAPAGLEARDEQEDYVVREDSEDEAAWSVAADDRRQPESPAPTWHTFAAEQEAETTPVAEHGPFEGTDTGGGWSSQADASTSGARPYYQDEQVADPEPAGEATWQFAPTEPAQLEPESHVEHEEHADPATWAVAADDQFETESPTPEWRSFAPEQDAEASLVAEDEDGSFAEEDITAGWSHEAEASTTDDELLLHQDEQAADNEPEAQAAGDATWTFASAETAQVETELSAENEDAWDGDSAGAAAGAIVAGDAFEPDSPGPESHDDASDDKPRGSTLPAAAVLAAALELGAAPAELEPLPAETLQPVASPDPELLADASETGGSKKKGKSSKGKGKGSKKDRSTQVVGVRIGSSHIVVSVVRNTHGEAEVSQLVSASVDRGVVVAGEVREPDALAAQLKSVFAKHKLPRKGIRLGIGSNRVGVRTLEVPAIDDQKALENAIRFRAQDVLSIPLSEVILDHVVLGKAETPEGEVLRVLLVFAHRELVDRYVEAFKKARLKLAGIDFEAFALLRAVCPPDGTADTDRATVALSVGQERTIFAVAEGRQCDFTRVLEWGGGSLTVALARALDMTPSQAEPVKRALAFNGHENHTELSAAQVESARSAARNELQVLARELLASLHFYQSRPGSLAIGEVLVTGGGMELDGAADELQALLGVPVKVIDPYGYVRPGKKAKISQEPGAAAIAIGLGMEA